MPRARMLALAALFTSLGARPAPAPAQPDGQPGEASARPARVAVAVAYFDNTSGAKDLAPLQKGFADMLITDLAAAEELAVVERSRLGEVLAEVALQRNPYFDQAAAARLGRGLSAGFLVTGAYLVQGATLRLDARVVDVETAEVVLTASAQGELARFFDVQRRLALDLLGGLGARLGLLQKKRVGSDNTRDLDAFRAYCDSLDARDAGDEGAERAALARALKADPDFARVKSRLAALERRVAALEKSGGRILAPTRARDYLHNARLEAAQGDYQAARRSLEHALRLRPELLDPWLLWVEIQGGPAPWGRTPGAKPNAKSSVAPGLRQVIDAYLRRDAAALHAAVQAAGAHRLHAAAFLFALVRGQLPARHLQPFVMAQGAVQVIEEAEAAGGLARLFVDPLPFLRSVRALRDTYLGADRAAQLATPARAVVRAADALFRPTSYWDISVHLAEQPQGPVSMTITRDRGHPHWAERAPPRRGDRLRGMWSVYPSDRRKALQAAAADPAKLVYRFGDAYEDPDRGGPLPSIAGFGDEFALAGHALRCHDDRDALTGTRCRAWFQVFKPSLAPGFYRLRLRYGHAGGQEVTRDIELWVPEFKLLPHRRVVGKGLSIYPGPDRTVISIVPQDAQALVSRLRGARTMEAKAETLVHGFYGDVDLFYDVDYSLNRGHAPKPGPRPWMRYRDRIRRKGYHMRVTRHEEHIPLPALAPGEHWLCMTTVRQNGSASPEAECHRLVIEAAP